ncbi:hypothetical protein RM780_00905 [Streptomyces sp. DSM 44917]|uniref:Uncharacterized protein n=1 Tax=Streptomyces boetiae TaxID=3075541 RepID=A0ABU2L1U1_9ACTN|nr:hypothetical protein [Streptomyces sp. DSM 44917]MDT0305525.1 hypothetical protein [Streptomyces sp. DSM 44917]
MTHQPHPSVSETSLAREIFGPLGGIVTLGAAVGETAVSVGDFAAARRAELDRLLSLIQEAGGFGDETMALVDELGWHRDHDATPFLAMWSGLIEPYPFDADDPAVIRRMVTMGADLQSVALLHALVAAATTRTDTDPARLTEEIAEALRVSCALLGEITTPAATFRAWRVARLAGILQSGPAVPEDARTRWRDYAHRLGALLLSDAD